MCQKAFCRAAVALHPCWSPLCVKMKDVACARCILSPFVSRCDASFVGVAAGFPPPPSSAGMLCIWKTKGSVWVYVREIKLTKTQSDKQCCRRGSTSFALEGGLIGIIDEARFLRVGRRLCGVLFQALLTGYRSGNICWPLRKSTSRSGARARVCAPAVHSSSVECV